MHGRSAAVEDFQPSASAPAANQPGSPAAAVKRRPSSRTPDPKAEARAMAFAKVGRQVRRVRL